MPVELGGLVIPKCFRRLEGLLVSNVLRVLEHGGPWESVLDHGMPHETDIERLQKIQA